MSVPVGILLLEAQLHDAFSRIASLEAELTVEKALKMELTKKATREISDLYQELSEADKAAKRLADAADPIGVPVGQDHILDEIRDAQIEVRFVLSKRVQ